MEMRSKTSKQRLGRVVFRLMAIIPLGLGLPACTSGPGVSQQHDHGAPSPAIVYASDAMLAWEAADAPIDADRFEFARNDPILGGGQPVALRATDQWPEPLRPIERPVVFRLFQQDRGAFGRFDHQGGRYGYAYQRDRGRYDGRYRAGYGRDASGSDRPYNGRYDRRR
ncbi:MAG: hypothetical protein Tsb0013_24480 [Phycisphaerales bacterium]